MVNVGDDVYIFIFILGEVVVLFVVRRERKYKGLVGLNVYIWLEELFFYFGD